MILGEIIYQYRHENQLSMDDFSKLSGISKPYISMLEKNKNSSNGKPIIPSLPTLKKVATATNMSLDELLYLLDRDQPIKIPGKKKSTPLLSEDEKDISIIIGKMKRLLTQNDLIFEGKPVSSENIQAILTGLQIGMEMARKQIAEEKKGDA